MHKKQLYLLHVFRKRLDYPDLRRAVKQQADLYKAKNILIEDKASGTQLIQDLQADGVHGTTRYEPQMDKIMRMHSVSSTIENGFVHGPDQAHWLPDYLHEISAFPKGKYDDQVDSTSQAFDWSKQGMDCLGVIKWEKKKAAEMGECIPAASTRHVTERPSRQPETQPDSRPCEACNGVMSQRIPNGLRCMQCGAQWLYPKARRRVQYISRADLLNKMKRFR